MNFEYDKNKSQSNKAKHGIDFEEIQLAWEDEQRVEIQTTHLDEKRYLNIGKIANRFYSIVITYRNNNIRIISARRSRKKEIEIYES